MHATCASTQQCIQQHELISIKNVTVCAQLGPIWHAADFIKAGSDIVSVHAEQSSTIHLHRVVNMVGTSAAQGPSQMVYAACKLGHQTMALAATAGEGPRCQGRSCAQPWDIHRQH